MASDKNYVFPEWSYYTLAVVYLGCTLSGILFNGMSINVLVRRNLLKNTTDVFVMCLSVSNIVMATLASPFATISSFAKMWIFGVKGCAYYGFIVCLTSYTNIALLVVIAVDRYIKMVKTNYNHLRTTWNAFWIAIGCFFHGFVFAIAPILGWSSYQPEGMGTHCCINWQSRKWGDLSLCIWLLVELWFLPLTLIVVCYFGILQKIKEQPCTTNTDHNRKKIGRKRGYSVVKTTMYIIVSFVCSWMPYAIVSIWMAIGNPDQIHPVLAAVPAVFVKTSMGFNPFVYMFRNKLFREAFYKEYPFLDKLFKKKVYSTEERIPLNFSFRLWRRP